MLGVVVAGAALRFQCKPTEGRQRRGTGQPRAGALAAGATSEGAQPPSGAKVAVAASETAIDSPSRGAH